MSQRETARAATHLEANALTMRALTREADEAAVLRLFLAAPAYTLAVEGRMPCQDDVDDFFEGMPPGKHAADKFMLGFELGAETIGCADLIRAHPEPDCAFLGLLLFDQARQGRGHGRAALGLIETLARGWGATRLRLAAVSSLAARGLRAVLAREPAALHRRTAGDGTRDRLKTRRRRPLACCSHPIASRRPSPLPRRRFLAIALPWAFCKISVDPPPSAIRPGATAHACVRGRIRHTLVDPASPGAAGEDAASRRSGSMSMKVLLIGATGRTGHALADLLLKQRDFELTALARRPGFALPGAKPVVADLNGDFSAAFQGISHAIYAAGSAESEGEAQEAAIDRDAVGRAAEYAKAANLQKLVVISSLSAYEPERGPAELAHYSRMKREGDDRVIASGVDYVILRPGPLSDQPGVGKIALTDRWQEDATPVARQDVAWAAVEAIKLGISRKIIGFIGGGSPIEQALRA